MSSDGSSGKRRAVVFDDSGLAAKIAAMRLTQAGMNVRVATTLEELKTTIEEFRPHALLSDLNVPEIPADDICGFLRRETAIGSAAIWLISGIDDDELRKQAEILGANGSVSKSLEAEDMVQRLLELVSALPEDSD